MNPLYRAIPEREWPMLASALNWSAAGPGVAQEDVAVARSAARCRRRCR